MYQLVTPIIGTEVQIVKKANGDGTITFIPLNAPDNTDYQAFLKYQAEGGKVYGADEEIPADEGTQ